MLDYEMELVNSAKINITIYIDWKGCLFYFLQILWRRVSEEKIRNKDRKNIISGLTLLAFIEQNQVIDAFKKIY